MGIIFPVCLLASENISFCVLGYCKLICHDRKKGVVHLRLFCGSYFRFKNFSRLLAFASEFVECPQREFEDKMKKRIERTKEKEKLSRNTVWSMNHSYTIPSIGCQGAIL